MSSVSSSRLTLMMYVRVWDLIEDMARKSDVNVQVRRPRWSRAVLKHQRLSNLCNNILLLIKV